MGGENHPVVLGREACPDLFQDLPEALFRCADHAGVIGLEGVRHRLSVAASVDPDEHRRVGCRVAAARCRVVAERNDRLVAGQTGEDVRLDIFEIGGQVAAEVVVAQGAVHEDLVVGPLVGTEGPVAACQEHPGQDDQQ